MHIDLNDIQNWENAYRLKFINSISGYKGVHLIGTKGGNAKTNLAIFNSMVHISSSPPLIGFIMRPLTVERHTYDNLMETGIWTVNHVHKSFLMNAHFTSAKFPREDSEFETCNLTEQYDSGIDAPFVKESKIKFAMKFKEDILIKSNDTRLIIGEIQRVIIDDKVIGLDGQLDLEHVHDVCVTGLNQYSSVSKFKKIPYARVNEVPNFKVKERPDNVVFDKGSQTYNSSLLPYGTNIGAPKITPTGVSAWKNSSITSFNHTFNNKIENLKSDYQKLIDEYQINDMLYQSKMNFQPIVGKVYHLYNNEKKNEHFLSLIPPESWGKTHLGDYKLNHEKLWERVSPAQS